MKKINLLSRAEMKMVIGGNDPIEGHNPNCGELNPMADYNCCLSNSIYHIGSTDCDSASSQCARMGGYKITSDPSRCELF